MEETISCPICDFETKWRSSLCQHVRSIHAGQTFQCSICEYKTSWKGDIQKHIKSVHEGKKFTKIIDPMKSQVKYSSI